MGIKDRLPLIRSERRIIRLFGYVVYAFVILCIIGILVPSPTPTPEAPPPKPSETPRETPSLIPIPSPIAHKYSAGNIIGTKTGIYEAIIDYSEWTDAYKTAIVEKKNGEWFYYSGIDPKRTERVDRNIIDENKDLSFIEQVDPTEINPGYVVGDILTKSGKEDTGGVILRYEDVTDKYGASVIQKILSDWYYSRPKEHPNRIIYEDRKTVEKDFPIFLEHIDPLDIKEVLE